MKKIINNFILREYFSKWFQSLKDKNLAIQFDGLREKFQEIPLFHSFSRFIADLTTITRMISRSSTTVNNNMREILTHSKDLQDNARNIRLTTGNFQKSMESLSEEITNINSELDEIRYQSKIMIEKNQNILEASEEIQKKVQGGVDVMSNSVFLISELVEQNRELNQTITELWSNYGSITAVARELLKVSKNTGLIALNAEIESAHAGDSGSGFAVVAKEMGKLARRNSEVSRMIAKSTSGMQEQAKLTELNVISSVEFAEGAQGEISKADHSYRNINQAIQMVMEDSREFSYSLKNLEISIIMIVNLLQQTNDLMANFISDSEQILDSIHAQETDIEKINSAVSSTFNVSRVINSLISQFTIPNFKQNNARQQYLEGVMEQILNVRGLVVMGVFSDDVQFTRDLFTNFHELCQKIQESYAHVDEFLNSEKEKISFHHIQTLWQNYSHLSDDCLQQVIAEEPIKAGTIYNQQARELIKTIVDELLALLAED